MRRISIPIICIVLPHFIFAQIGNLGSLDGYQRKRMLLLNYQGLQGHTIGLEFGNMEHCADCQSNHRKFFGFGLEGGIDFRDHFVFGPKISYQQGDDDFGLRMTLFSFSGYKKQLSVSFRGEILFFPVKSRTFSIGAGINLHRNLTTGKNYDSFGVAGLNLRYYFQVKVLD